MIYALIVSLFINLCLLCKLSFMHSSLKSLRTDFSERSTLDSNTLLGTSSKDREILKLTSAMNDTLNTLRGSYHKYRQGDAEVKTAITNIAHDLRTPLTAICGYAEMGLVQEDPGELIKYLTVISERAEHMKKLTGELFEYSMITGGEQTEELKDVNINHVLEDCVMNFYPEFEKKKMTPLVDITETPVVRSLYPSYVERIFSNLLSNALKYSDGDPGIILRSDGTVTISNPAGDLSGVDVNKLFDRFFTVETARNSNSHGLGLSIVKTLAERMNCPLEAGYENGCLVISIRFQ